jgi:Flp pilus assembly pilin Flp
MSSVLLAPQERLLLALARRRDDAGQATAEYALVVLGAAALALLVVGWATKTDVVGKLLDLVFGQLTQKTKLP